MDTETTARVEALAEDVSEKFERIEQDVPDQSYLVGGSVRDAIMGLPANDMDFVVVGESEATMEARGFEPTNASSFPVLLDSEGDEWALARTEEKSGQGYKGFDVETENVSLKADLKRRDLSMNALCLDVRDDKEAYQSSVGYDVAGDGWGLIDPHGGREDIENGVLRHVSDAFSDDPLRVMRVARYASRFAVPSGEEVIEYDHGDGAGEDDYHQFAVREENVVHAGFQVADGTMELMRQVAPELNRTSSDRIGAEIVKAMQQARRPSRFWEVLLDAGALAVLFPELDLAEIVPAGPEEYHYEDSCFDHLGMVVDEMHELCEDREITGEDRVRRLLMAVMHDVGKPVQARKAGGLHSDDPPVRFGGHDETGAERMEAIVGRLGLDQFEAVCEDAARCHMDVHDLPDMSAQEMLDFGGDRLDNVYGASLDELIDLAESDHQGRFEVTYRDEMKGLDEERVGFEQPTFDREPFEMVRDAIEYAVESTDGYTVMRDRACDDHSDTEDVKLAETMHSCAECPEPGEWIGEEIQAKRIERVISELDPDE
jgi:tRNA nucleotidyltransferase (CCA-adding enzyme)